MPLVKRSCIDKIRNSVDLVDLVSNYVQLRRSGSTWKGLSPFTTEKTPSFFVNQTKGLYYCFSTGQGGDMFKFIQQMEHLNFSEAVEFIANKYNIPLEYEEKHQGGSMDEKPSLRKELYLIHELATQFFHEQFMANNAAAETMRNYWVKERRFELETAKDYKIGFAPVDGNLLVACLERKQISLEAMLKCGIFYGPQNTKRIQQLSARFRGRLMIPIRDIQGRVIAFTARKTALTPNDHASEEAKYINSPETPVFTKGQQLFNLDRAKSTLSKEKNMPALLVEGQLDAIRCHSCGITNAIAPQGTAITDTQLRLIKRFTGKLECLLDGDSAGQKAAIRLIKLAVPAELDVDCLVLPPKEDPDSLFSREGKTALDALRKNATPGIDFFIKSLLPDLTAASAMEKDQALEAIFELFSEIKNPFTAREHITKIGQKFFNIRDDLIYANFEKFKQRQIVTQKQEVQADNRQNAFIDPKVQNGLTTQEEVLLWIVLNHEEIGESCTKKLDAAWLSNKPAGKMLGRILAEIKEGLWDSHADHSDLWETEEEQKIYYLCTSVSIPNANMEKLANDCIKDIYKKHFSNLRENAMRKMSRLDSSNMEELKNLQEVIKLADNALRTIPESF